MTQKPAGERLIIGGPQLRGQRRAWCWVAMLLLGAAALAAGCEEHVVSRGQPHSPGFFDKPQSDSDRPR